MFGYVEWIEDGKRGVQISEKRILSLPFCCASIVRSAKTPQTLVRLRTAEAARQLKRRGIRRAVFPVEFPFLNAFICRGIFPVDPVPLYRALAADLADAVMKKKGAPPADVPVTVCADALTAEVRRAVTALCVRCRYVTFSCPGGGETFCRELRREYGAVLTLTDDPRLLDRGKIRVLFSPREDLEKRETDLLLYHGGTLPPVLLHRSGEDADCVPRDADRSELFAALYAAGILRTEEIEIDGKTYTA